jgi:hypothetical protein
MELFLFFESCGNRMTESNFPGVLCLCVCAYVKAEAKAKHLPKPKLSKKKIPTANKSDTKSNSQPTPPHTGHPAMLTYTGLRSAIGRKRRGIIYFVDNDGNVNYRAGSVTVHPTYITFRIDEGPKVDIYPVAETGATSPAVGHPGFTPSVTRSYLTRGTRTMHEDAKDKSEGDAGENPPTTVRRGRRQWSTPHQRGRRRLCHQSRWSRCHAWWPRPRQPPTAAGRATRTRRRGLCHYGGWYIEVDASPGTRRNAKRVGRPGALTRCCPRWQHGGCWYQLVRHDGEGPTSDAWQRGRVCA